MNAESTNQVQTENVGNEPAISINDKLKSILRTINEGGRKEKELKEVLDRLATEAQASVDGDPLAPSAEAVRVQMQLSYLSPSIEAAKRGVVALAHKAQHGAGALVGKCYELAKVLESFARINATKRALKRGVPESVIDAAIFTDPEYLEMRTALYAIRPPWVSFDCHYSDTANPVEIYAPNEGVVQRNKNEPKMEVVLKNPTRDAQAITVYYDAAADSLEKHKLLAVENGIDPENLPATADQKAAIVRQPRHYSLTPEGEENFPHRVKLECITSCHVGVVNGRQITADAGDTLDLPSSRSQSSLASSLLSLSANFRLVNER